MNTNIEWMVIQHKVVTRDVLLEIAKMKDQYWQHGIDSQVKWMNDNLSEQDTHLIGVDADSKKIIAYLAMVKVHTISNHHSLTWLGLGNVCVDEKRSGNGIGGQLVQKANQFIEKSGHNGILLCKDALVPFYIKCGWSNEEYENVNIAGSEYHGNVMYYGCPKNIDEDRFLYIDKNF